MDAEDSSPGLKIRNMAREDIEEVREVGQKAWSDLASKDLGRRVKYPLRPRRLVEAYMWKEPEGCLIAEDDGRIVGSAFCHVWGKIGWVGPFEVLPELQNRGVGRALMLSCEKYLDRRGCVVFGLETMPHITKNIHFYLTAGYLPAGMTLISVKSLTWEQAFPNEKVQEVECGDLEQWSPQISNISARINPNLDFSREFEMAVRMGLGSGFVYRSKGKVCGCAILHAVHPLEESDHVSVRLVSVDPRAHDGVGIFSILMGVCESKALEWGRKRAFIRFAADNLELYGLLRERGYKLEAANIRMMRGISYEERGPYHLAAWAG